MTNPIRAALERLLSDIQDLSDSSQGIVGLHRNGDPAPWNELLEGGRYSSWLGDAITAARAALAAVPEGEGPPAVTISALLHPTYEPGDGSADGAQIVGMQWWHPVMGCDSLQLVVDNARNILRSRWARPAAPPADLPPDYIDEWITNPRDRALLEVFHKACNAEGGSADEVILRGLKAVLQDGLSRSHRLQQENHRFSEPERTILCDILANGTLLPDPDGTRYGIPPAPLEGEVGELLAELEVAAVTVESEGGDHEAAAVRRAAELLQQQHPTPVPVSERLPGDQLCWWYEPDEPDGYGGRWNLLRIRGGTGTFSHWLPAHALPLPQEEVE